MQDRTSYSYRADTPGSNPDMYQVGGMARDAFKRMRGQLAPKRQDPPQHSEWEEPKPVLKPRSAQGVKDMKKTASELQKLRREGQDLSRRLSPETHTNDRKEFEAIRGKADKLMHKSQHQIRSSEASIAEDQREAAFRAQRVSPYIRQTLERGR